MTPTAALAVWRGIMGWEELVVILPFPVTGNTFSGLQLAPSCAAGMLLGLGLGYSLCYVGHYAFSVFGTASGPARSQQLSNAV